MRRSCLVAALVVAAPARAEVSVGGQVGAGAQGAATYSAVELRLDAQGRRGHLGLGARGVWDDGQFRGRDWSSGWSALTIIRDAAIAGTVGEVELAAAAGALAPAYVGRIVDGYRVALDDRWRTGVRTAARSQRVEASAEIDDVLDPRLVAGGASWLVTEAWGVHGSAAIDPGEAGAVELGGFRRFARDGMRLDLGASIVVEPAPSGVAFASAAVEHAGARWTVRGDARYGTAGLFGPLYRVEGTLDTRGLGAGLAAGVASERGWVELGARRRPGLGGLYVANAGAPMGRWLQAGAWAAVGRDAAAGAAELRVTWSQRLFSAIQAARMYRTDAMTLTPVWSITTWFGATTL